jgi:hypothetical protein
VCQALTRIPQEEYLQTFNKLKNVHEINLLDYNLFQKDPYTIQCKEPTLWLTYNYHFAIVLGLIP